MAFLILPMNHQGIVPRIDGRLDHSPGMAFIAYRADTHSDNQTALGVTSIAIRAVSNGEPNAAIRSLGRVLAKWNSSGGNTGIRTLEAGTEGVQKAFDEIRSAIEAAGYTIGVDIQAIPIVRYKISLQASGEDQESSLVEQANVLVPVVAENPLVKCVIFSGCEIPETSLSEGASSGNTEVARATPIIHRKFSAESWKTICQSFGKEYSLYGDDVSPIDFYSACLIVHSCKRFSKEWIFAKKQ